MTGRKTPPHHTGHTEPIRTPALRHSIDGNHPELREGQEDSALIRQQYFVTEGLLAQVRRMTA